MEMVQFNNPTIKEILEYFKTLWALGHLAGVAEWDLRTYIPEDGVTARGFALAKAATLQQKLFLDKKFTELIEKAEKEKNLNDCEKGAVRVLKRSLRHYEKLPPEFIEEFEKTVTEADVAWRQAKEKNDFKIFEKHLEKIVELCIKKAEYLGYDKSPYDALLDDFEEGLTAKDAEKFFASIKKPLKKLLEQIKNSKKYKEKHALEKETYDTEKMKILNLKALEFFQCSPRRLRMDISAHPFTIYFSLNDARITTRYGKNDFARSLSATVHEFGHALYGMQCNEKLEYTPLFDTDLSLVIHESQSRFWENIIGRSGEFIKKIRNEIIKINPKFNKYGTDDLHEYFNLVRPSLIRTEADEITYHFHIMIRFEIERALIEKKIKVKDLPEVWKAKYKEHLGIEPKNDSEGVLQDVHWAHGAIGYFPTYSIGTFLSGLIKYEMEHDLGNINNLIKSKAGINQIKAWLKEKIHQYGSTYPMKELVKKSFKKDLNTSYHMDYLERKYKEQYNIK